MNVVACASTWRRGFMGACLVALAVCFLGGCAASKSKVSGVVTYAGKPVTGGTLTFIPTGGKSNQVIATISPEGKFDAILPLGEVMVAVDTRGVKNPPSAPIGVGGMGPMLKAGGGPMGAKGPPKGVGMGPSPEQVQKMKDEGKDITNVTLEKQAGTYVDIPEKYYKTETSELRYTIKGDTKELNIELK